MQIWSSQTRQLEIDMQNHGLEFDGTKDVEAQMLRDIKELKHIVRVTIIRNLDLLYLQVFLGDFFLWVCSPTCNGCLRFTFLEYDTMAAKFRFPCTFFKHMTGRDRRKASTVR